MKRLQILLIIFAVSSCVEPLEIYQGLPEGTDNLFPGTFLISIPPYHYFDPVSLDTFLIEGDADIDSFSAPPSPDVPVPQVFLGLAGEAPEIQWESFPTEHLVAGIFTDSILVSLESPKEITNVEDMIWTWNTTVNDGGSIGDVKYFEGHQVIDGETVVGADPPTLIPDSTYYFAVWGFDDQRKKIVYSSRQIRIKIAK